MRMMPAGFFSLTTDHSPKKRGVIRIERVRDGGKRGGKARRESDAAELHRTQPAGYKRQSRRKGGAKWEERRRKERKKEGKRGFLQKNRILQIFVGII